MSTLDTRDTRDTRDTESRARPLRVVVVAMPWANLDAPSLALSTLVPIVRSAACVGEVEAVYGNLQWADYLCEHTGGDYRPEDYERVAGGYFASTGEWIFSGALYDRPDPLETEFYRFGRREGADLDLSCRAYRLAAGFTDALADRIAATRPDVVGFTTAFLQTVPSLALARRLKERSPETVVVFGGASCDGEQGSALHGAFPFADHVVRGEAEHTLPALLEAIAVGRAGDRDAARAQFGEIAGLCWRDADGTGHVNAATGRPVAMQDVPTPVFDAYFEALDAAVVRKWIEPRIWLEGSRGCWWGAKHHCTFCGLNGTTMAYRSKPAERLWDEMLDAMTRHRTLDLMLADNILDMGYLDSLLPLLRDSGIDARIFAEVKSNLRFDQLAGLADARFVQIQPGIENLSTQVLKLMRKGVTGPQNVRLLRDCTTLGISVLWNYLYGFPGEQDEHYTRMLRQFPALVHLQPAEIAVRVALERFSPYFDDPSLGLVSLGPSRFLTAIHPLPADVMDGLAYLYDSVPAGIGADVVTELETALARWRREHCVGGLTLAEDDSAGAHTALLVRDRRPGFEPRDHRFDQGLEETAYLGLLRGRTLPSLRRMLAERGFDVAPERLQALVLGWFDHGLLFEESGTYLALASGAPRCALPFLGYGTDRKEDHRAGDDSRSARLLPLVH